MPPGIVGDVSSHALSPDGAWLVYRADGDQDEVFELYSVLFSGGTPVKLNGTLASGGDVGNVLGVTFQISSDSSRVVYLADQDANDKFELYTVPIAGGAAVKLNPALPATGDVVGFAIAPDSSRVVFLSTTDRTELYSVPVAGGVATKLNPSFAAGRAVTSFAISPDSTSVVYRADQAADELFELYSVPLGGGAATKLNPALVANGDVSDDPAFKRLRFRISPDSSRVVYAADQVTDGFVEMFSVPLGGGSSTQLGVPTSFVIGADSANVVYTSLDAGKVQLFSVPLTGGTSTKLNGPLVASGAVISYSVSPDASRVVYAADEETNEVNELYGVPTTGGTVVKLSPPLTPDGDVVSSSLSSTFSISPDSSRVVYRAYADFGVVEDLYSAPLAGGSIVKLNPALGADQDVSGFVITPDSSRVVYSADQDVDGISELFSVPITGGPVVQVSPTSPYLTSAQGAQVTPDSSAVAFLSDADAPGVQQSYRAPVSGGAATRLSSPLAFVPSAGDVRSHAASPDGKRIVYLADQDVDEVVELYSVPTAGGPIVKLNGPLVGIGDVTQFRITPDSTTVLYLASQEGPRPELYRVPIEGGAAVKLNPPLPAGVGRISTFEVSPDGAMVVYTGIQEPPEAFAALQLYSIAITGGVPILLNEPLSIPLQVSRFEISPDSSRVVFQLLYEDGSQYYNPYIDLYSVPILGGPVAELCSAQTYCLSFHLAPDSSRAIFTADVDTPNLHELYSVPIDGGVPVKLNPQLGGGSVAHDLLFCPLPSCSGSPPTFDDTWERISPDSTRAVFTASESSSGLRELYSVPLAGGPATKLNVPPLGVNIPDRFEIAAGSSQVVYLGPRPGGGNAVYRVPIAGGSSFELNGALVPGGSVGAHLESPDGSTVVYIADQDANDVFELYRV